MGSLFGSSNQTSTQINDPWSTMPEWLEESLKKKVAQGDKLFEIGAGIGHPGVTGQTPEERAAMNEITAGYDRAGMLGDFAAGGLGQDFDSGFWDPDADFTSAYTDDVVDTTLAGMERQAQRERLAREGRAAAVGGTSNTRAAVGQAVADQLTGMNMAQMEAKLRDDAHRFGVDSSFRERSAAQDAFQYDRDSTMEEIMLADKLAGSELGRSMQYGGALGSFGETRRGIMDRRKNQDRDQISWLSQLLSGTNQAGTMPTGSTSTSTTPGPSGFSQILGAGTAILGGILSDENAKEDITDMDSKKALEDLRALRPAEYEYKEGMGHRKDRHAGLIAQSAEGIEGAVVERDDGLKEMDAFPVLATIVSAVQELDREVRENK